MRARRNARAYQALSDAEAHIAWPPSPLGTRRLARAESYKATPPTVLAS